MNDIEFDTPVASVPSDDNTSDSESDSDDEGDDFKNPLSGLLVALTITGCFSKSSIETLLLSKKADKPMSSDKRKAFQLALRVGGSYDGNTGDLPCTIRADELPLCLKRRTKKVVEVGNGLSLVKTMSLAGPSRLTYDLETKTMTSGGGELKIHYLPGGRIGSIEAGQGGVTTSQKTEDVDIPLLSGALHAGTKELNETFISNLKKISPPLASFIPQLHLGLVGLSSKFGSIIGPDAAESLIRPKSNEVSQRNLYGVYQAQAEKIDPLIVKYMKKVYKPSTKNGATLTSTDLYAAMKYHTTGRLDNQKPPPGTKDYNFSQAVQLLVAMEQIRTINPDVSKHTRDYHPLFVGVCRKMLNVLDLFKGMGQTDLHLLGVGTSNIQHVHELGAAVYDIDPKAGAQAIQKRDVTSSDFDYSGGAYVSDCQASPEKADDYWREVFSVGSRKPATKDHKGPDYTVRYGNRFCATAMFAHCALTRGVKRWGGKIQFRADFDEDSVSALKCLIGAGADYIWLIGEGGNPHNFEKEIVFIHREVVPKLSDKIPTVTYSSFLEQLRFDAHYALGVNYARLIAEVEFRFPTYETPALMRKFRFVLPKGQMYPYEVEERETIVFQNDKLGKPVKVGMSLEAGLMVDEGPSEALDLEGMTLNEELDEPQPGIDNSLDLREDA